MHEYTKYFKETPGFNRFVGKMYEKYKSLGVLSGTIKISLLKEDEALALSRLFAEDFQVGENITLSMKKFFKIMAQTRFEDFDSEMFLQEYFNERLITNKEMLQKEKNEENCFYEKIVGDISWLKNLIEEKGQFYKLIHQRYLKDKISLKKELTNIIKLTENIPKTETLLPIFASTYTKDPHYLDLESNHSHLFMLALAYKYNEKTPQSREDKIKLLAKYNIEVDNLSNFVITYNLTSDKESINSFSKNNETLILNIQNILSTNVFTSLRKKVFIFENPSILNAVLANKLDISVIISGGYPNSSVHLLLEKLIASGNILYYNGDFDPEGLLIAEKLTKRYKDKLELINYSAEDYYACISKKRITERRINILKNISTPKLNTIKNCIIEENLAAYQENNIERILASIKEILNK